MSKGKIEFDKVTDKTVKFHWSKPESGSDVKSYIIERALKDNYELWEKVKICKIISYSSLFVLFIRLERLLEM